MTPERRQLLLRTKRKILLARDSLLDFAQYMRPDPNAPDDPDRSAYQIAAHHEFIARKLEEVEDGKIQRLIISCPPRHGKSELAQKTFVPWVAGRNPDWSFITATYNQNFSEDFGRAVRDIMRDPRYRNVFPGVALSRDAQSVGRLVTETRAQLSFVGRGGSLTGRGGHVLVIDDPFKDRQEADSPTIRDALWKWFTQVLRTRLMTDDGRIVIIMTRWHEDDLVGRLTDPSNPHYNAREAANWEVINLPALAGDNDPLGRAEGEPLWPGRFGTSYLVQFRNQDPRGFSALYQGRPTPDEGLFFGPEDIVEYQSMKDVPENLRMYGVSDHAVSTTQWADKNAFIIFGVDEEDTIWIHPDTVLKRLDSRDAVETMLRLIQKHHPLFWWAESGHISKSIGPFLRKRMVEERTYCPLIELTPTKDKQTRAQAIKGRMSMQKVRFPAWTSWYEEARHQILTFPAGTKDDFVDGLSLIGMGLALQQPSTRPKTAAKDPKYGTLGWLKNDTKRRELIETLKKNRQGW